MVSRSFAGQRARRIVMGITVAIMICGITFTGAAQARQATGTSGTSGAVPVETRTAVPAPSMSYLPRVMVPLFGAGTAKNKWLDGAMQSNMDQNCITGNLEAVTTEFVGYWGNEDVTSPRVGDVYYGRAGVGDVGGPCAGPLANVEVILPPNTFFAIDKANPVRCSIANISDWKFTDLPEKKCPQKPRKGQFGWILNQPDGSPWDIRGGKLVLVAFPMVSMKKMSGIATNSYMTGAIQAIDGQFDPWDDPKQGVFVADNPPSIAYDKQAVTGITATGAKTTAAVLNHYTAGKAAFEIGTTTRYGLKGETIAIKSDANSYNAYQTWVGLKPNTTYHWRVRFVASNGKAYTGADQTFVTKAK